MENDAGETRSLEIEPSGLLTAQTDPRGNRSQYFFDLLGRITRASDAAGASRTSSRPPVINFMFS